ncbi:succinate dehydrogenase assembly factor 4 [Aspergillus lucknowensis]|uniref:Succinate dehydrogenase assembly factor 4, mitochondrial n=1 Tax=Aspergillus lucknowensis TaxID=176173 RepID=A0ABR4M5Y2_9EURO
MAIAIVSRRLLTRPSVTLPTRAFSSPIRHSSDDSNSPFVFRQGPAPPRLPKEEQEIFEKLQQQSTGAFSTPRATPQVNQSPNSEPELQSTKFEAKGDGEELHPDMKPGLRPEFEGEKNPKTGEIGGPKNEPLRWGSGGDWSYGGRVTDF